MRGKVSYVPCFVFHVGITPAYAGKRYSLIFSSSPTNGSPPRMRGKATGISQAGFLARDHPRVCGEKFYMSSFQANQMRITPAYAGKRFAAWFASSTP